MPVLRDAESGSPRISTPVCCVGVTKFDRRTAEMSGTFEVQIGPTKMATVVARNVTSVVQARSKTRIQSAGISWSFVVTKESYSTVIQKLQDALGGGPGA